MIEEDPQSFERVLSSMCTEPHPAARAASTRFLATNPGDPGSFPQIASIERRVIDRLGQIVSLDPAYGYIASGGTEGNIQAVRVARNQAQVSDPNIVVSESGHFSFQKAAEILGVEYRQTALDEEFRADVDAMAAAIDENTILVAGVAGSTEFGRVDPIPAIAELADDEDIHCHVDAAWGGFILPFTDHEWDFGHATIDSLTIDPHKYGRAAIPSGGFLVRDESALDSLRIDTPYLRTDTQFTLGGTRSGAGVASAEAAIDALWPAGYERQYHRCQELADWLAAELHDRDFTVRTPELPLVSVELAETPFIRLRERGWRIARTSEDTLRIVCMPHVTNGQLREFLADFDTVTDG